MIEHSTPTSDSDTENSRLGSLTASDDEYKVSKRHSSISNLSDTDYETELPLKPSSSSSSSSSSSPSSPPLLDSTYDWFLNDPSVLPPPLTRNSESDYEADYDSGSDFE